MLPVDLLRPLSIGEGSTVLALYYPRGAGPAYDGVPDCHDLMITPVPLRYWPVMGRLIVRLRHAQGTMAAVASWLRDREISILNTECSRSAHRYATWNLTIAFDALVGKSNRFDASASEHVATRRAASVLRRDLEGAFDDDILFREPTDRGLRHAVEIVPIRTHSYFHHYLSASADSPKSRLFELYSTQAQLQSRDDRLGALLNELEGLGESLAPTCVVAEMDTRDFNIRVAIVPPSQLHRFFEVVVPYRRTGGQSTRGLIASVTERLAGRYNLWRVFNSNSQNGTDVEAGETVLCVEDCKKSADGLRDRKRDLEQVVDDLRKETRITAASSTKILPHVQVDPISPVAVKARLTRERAEQTGLEYDVFISYGKRDGKRAAKRVGDLLEVQGIRTHLDTSELQPGQDWHQGLIEGIRRSSEVAVVCTRRSLDRPWIAIEIGCALGLDKNVTAILCGDIDPDEIPEYLKRYQGVVLRADRGLRAYGESVLRRLARTARY
jgi:hypothetical protein